MTSLTYPARACSVSHFSRVQLFMTLCTVACQAPLSMGFFGQEYWSGLPCPPPLIPTTSPKERKTLLSFQVTPEAWRTFHMKPGRKKLL